MSAECIIRDRNQVIGWEEAYDILQRHHEYKCFDVPPVKPKGGEIFLFEATESSKRSKLVCRH